MILKCFCVTAESFWCELHTANICLKTMSWSYWYEQHTVNIFSGRCCGLVGTRTLLQIFVLPQCCDLIDASNIPFYMLTLIKKVIEFFKMGKLRLLIIIIQKQSARCKNDLFKPCEWHCAFGWNNRVLSKQKYTMPFSYLLGAKKIKVRLNSSRNCSVWFLLLLCPELTFFCI